MTIFTNLGMIVYKTSKLLEGEITELTDTKNRAAHCFASIKYLDDPKVSLLQVNLTPKFKKLLNDNYTVIIMKIS
ncbi:hypothetical protein [Xylocopilactobacillus apicola]|uniref:hypothetical protein n=1 Tax=Xylocopilactobacillus apicola TaxID=2932184 RepID=UPI002955AC15|nr:hypothetical protein [Xylocopilactobacillus apicola]